MKLLVLLSVCLAVGWAEEEVSKKFYKGRPETGFLPKWPEEVEKPAREGSVPGLSVGWFNQKLDHIGSYPGTFKQQYNMFNQYYNPSGSYNGPMFVMISGESPMYSGWSYQGDWAKNAKTYGALMFQLEHRYYGQSIPPFKDCSTPNMRFLTSEQALADLANFITSMKQQLSQSNPKYRSLANAKVFVFGGSYAGNLAAWFRLKYPHITAGAVASSAPVWATPDFYQYLEVVTKSLNTKYPGCSNNVKQAFTALRSLVQSNSGQVTTMFNTCPAIDTTNSYNLQSFYSDLVGPFQGAVQYDSMSTTGSNVIKMCKVMADTTKGTPLQRLAYLMKMQQAGQCMGIGYSGEITWLQGHQWTSNAVASGTRQWIYQTCNEFGYYQTTDSNNQCFGKGEMSLGINYNMCQQVFGTSQANVQNAIQQTDTYYGARNYKGSCVVFPDGGIDPWHALSVNKSMGPTTVFKFIPLGSHCYDMGNPSQSDSATLIQVRKYITGFIGNCLRSNNP